MTVIVTGNAEEIMAVPPDLTIDMRRSKFAVITEIFRRPQGGFKSDSQSVDRKYGKGPKKISLKALRNERPSKGAQQKQGRDERRPFRGGKRQFNKGRKANRAEGRKLPKDAEKAQEILDKEMENYWIKGGNTELGKYIIEPLWTSLTDLSCKSNDC